MNEKKFIALAKRHFATILGIDESEVEKLYDFVNTHFHIDVVDSKCCFADKPQRFTARLQFYQGPGDFDDDLSLISFGDKELGGEGAYFDEFTTKEAALEAAYKHVNSVRIRLNDFIFGYDKRPLNMLVLFDKDYQKE